jgi:hypothetical protein
MSGETQVGPEILSFFCRALLKLAGESSTSQYKIAGPTLSGCALEAIEHEYQTQAASAGCH